MVQSHTSGFKTIIQYNMMFCLSIIAWLAFSGELGAANVTPPVEIYDKKILSNSKTLITSTGNSNPPNFELVLNLRNNTQNREDELIDNHYEKRTRNNRRKKERQSKLFRQKNKSSKTVEFDIGRIHRNDEKDMLVRNRTIEILKNGFKILSTNGEQSFEGNKTSSQVNETLLEKILSSGASKPDLLISGIYKLPIGGNIYENKEIDHIKSTSIGNGKSNFSEVKSVSQEKFLFEDRKDKTSHDQTFNYEYDYEEVKDSNNRNDIIKPYAYNSDYEAVGVDSNVRNVLEQIITTLRSLTEINMDGNFGDDDRSSFKDPCSRWLECKHHLEKAFLGQNVLPSCPCHYPSTIFYNDAIWDENQKKFFRWRDASNEAERLDIYKPGAVYCIRSLLAQSGASISSQQCCYDGKLRLLTRGSGAGTINFVSPDVSKELHDTIDVLPWRLCKGDFTRYNLARQPDNGNQCSTNPNDELYELQVKLSKYFR